MISHAPIFQCCVVVEVNKEFQKLHDEYVRTSRLGIKGTLHQRWEKLKDLKLWEKGKILAVGLCLNGEDVNKTLEELGHVFNQENHWRYNLYATDFNLVIDYINENKIDCIVFNLAKEM